MAEDSKKDIETKSSTVRRTPEMQGFGPPVYSSLAQTGLVSPSLVESGRARIEMGFPVYFETQNKQRQFERETIDLREKVDQLSQSLTQKDKSLQKKQKETEELQKKLEELGERGKIDYLLRGVREEVHLEILNPASSLRQKFLESKKCEAFVMSIDIRRSTELMLKARTPQAFASFITDLSRKLIDIVKDSYGVFDKFTGDGILAFFPDFYSGPDAAYYAMTAAEQCHAAFERLYRTSRKSFTSILKDIGLGIGIDYGPVHLVQLGGALTVVGPAVVYACRLSGAPGGVTLVNQPAYEVISEKFGPYCFLDEKAIEIKHEGQLIAYQVKPNNREYEPSTPEWVKQIDNGKETEEE